MPAAAALPLSSLSSLHAAFVGEHAILEQVVYRNRNQHRKANYFQHLTHVVRHHRHIDLLALADALSAVDDSSTPPLLLSTIDRLRSSLCAILRAADPLYALLQQTYFMPLALTSLALLARLLVVVKAALLQLLTEAKEREAQSREGAHFARHSVGESILTALKEAKGELVVVELDGYGLHEHVPGSAGHSRAWVSAGRPAAPFASASLAAKQMDNIPFLDDAAAAQPSFASLSGRSTHTAAPSLPPHRQSSPAVPAPTVLPDPTPSILVLPSSVVRAEADEDEVSMTGDEGVAAVTAISPASSTPSSPLSCQQLVEGEASVEQDSESAAERLDASARAASPPPPPPPPSPPPLLPPPPPSQLQSKKRRTPPPPSAPQPRPPLPPSQQPPGSARAPSAPQALKWVAAAQAPPLHSRSPSPALPRPHPATSSLSAAASGGDRQQPASSQQAGRKRKKRNKSSGAEDEIDAIFGS